MVSLGDAEEQSLYLQLTRGSFQRMMVSGLFFAALLTSRGGCVLFFAIRGFREHQIPFPLNAPKKNGQPG